MSEVAAYTQGLWDDDPAARADAAAGLHDAADTEEIPARARTRLVELLADAEPMVRLEAALVLAKLRDTHATAVLVSFLDDRDRRLDAALALGDLGDASASPALKRLQRWTTPWAERLVAAAALLQLGDRDARAALLKETRSWRIERRAFALHLLGRARDSESFELLVAALAQKDPVQTSAVDALGRLGDVRARPHLERLASETRDDELRAHIEEVLRALTPK